MSDTPSNPILVIADIHLQPGRVEHPINRTFLRFLNEKAVHAQALYILGDLFEVWLGDDIGLEQYRNEIQALKKLSDSGVKLYIQYGNRDFLMRKRFFRETGAQYLPDKYALQIGEHKLLMLHGDQLCTLDTQYQKMRRWLRNPVIQWLFLLLPKSKRIKIGNKMRQESMQAGADKASQVMDVSHQGLASLFKHYPGYLTLIHGHTHKPALHHERFFGQEYQRYVLGDWRPQTEYLEISTNAIERRTFK